MALPVIALAWLFGMASVGVWGGPAWVAGATLFALAPLGWRLAGRYGAWVMAAAAVAALVGGWLYEATIERDLPPLAAVVGQSVILEGVVASEPDPGLTTVGYRINVERVTSGGETRPTDGDVLVRLNQYARYLPGDRLRVAGDLEAPPERLDDGFRYREYLLRKGVVGTMLFPRVERAGPPTASVKRWSTALRLRLERSLQRSLPEPEASLAAGVAFGRDDSLSPQVANDFRRSGLAHLTAVSGSNVALVAALAFLLFVPLVGRYWATLPAGLLIVAYLAAAGFSPSVVRSAIMALVLLGGLWLGRPRSGLDGLGAAAIAMTAFTPGVASDVGFQLSLAATAGLMVFEPWIRFATGRALNAVRLDSVVPPFAVQAFALTTSATIATLPIVAHTFGRVSVIGVAANVVASPLFALAFVLSGVAAFAGVVHPSLGWVAGLFAFYPLWGLVRVAELSAAVPGAAVNTPGVGSGAAMAWGAAYVAGGWLAYRRFAPVLRRPRPVARARLVRRGALSLAGGGCAAVVLGISFLPLDGPGRLEVEMLDIGQGDAILIRTPGGRNVLVDGGPSGIGLARQLGAALPHWDKRLDLVILTHPQDDHIGGLPGALARFDVGTVLTAGDANDTANYRAFRERAGAARTLVAGETFSVGDVHFEVLWPARDYEGTALNNRSLVLRMTYGATTFLLTGDIEAPVQRTLMAEQGAALRADVLKAPHHGSKTSTPEFFAAVKPSLALISAGAGNRFGHPAAETLDSLQASHVFRTDQDGRVIIRSDGRRITWEARR